jgi:hypothetical protein
MKQARRQESNPVGAPSLIDSSGRVLLQVGRDFVEGVLELAAQRGDRKDDRDCDERGDQGVFDSGGAGLICDELLDGLDHVFAPAAECSFRLGKSIARRNSRKLGAARFKGLNRIFENRGNGRFICGCAPLG